MTRPTVSITFMSGPLDGKTLTWEVPSDGSELTIVIGRNNGLDISISHDQQVSRVHAHVIYEPRTDRFFLVDKKSRNHTFVGSRREKLEPEQRHTIKAGALFQVGRTWLRIDDGESSSSDEVEADY
jgi:pSer/pThr/pTyr-binding forkhead associated (FHA) protein